MHHKLDSLILFHIVDALSVRVKIWADKNIDLECKSRKRDTLVSCDVLIANLFPRKEVWLDQDKSLSMMTLKFYVNELLLLFAYQ